MDKTYTRRVFTERTVTTDGEVKEEKGLDILVEDDKEFYLIYCKVVGLFHDLQIGELKTIAWLTANMMFNSNMHVITLSVKEKIAKEMDMGVNSVSNAVSRLLKKGILYKEVSSNNELNEQDQERSKSKRGALYYINPEFYWKGDLSERNRVLKVVVELRKKKQITLPEEYVTLDVKKRLEEEALQRKPIDNARISQ